MEKRKIDEELIEKILNKLSELRECTDDFEDNLNSLKDYDIDEYEEVDLEEARGTISYLYDEVDNFLTHVKEIFDDVEDGNFEEIKEEDEDSDSDDDYSDEDEDSDSDDDYSDDDEDSDSDDNYSDDDEDSDSDDNYSDDDEDSDSDDDYSDDDYSDEDDDYDSDDDYSDEEIEKYEAYTDVMNETSIIISSTTDDLDEAIYNLDLYRSNEIDIKTALSKIIECLEDTLEDINYADNKIREI